MPFSLWVTQQIFREFIRQMAISIERADDADIEAMVKLLGLLFSIEQDFSPDETAQRRGLQLLLNAPEQTKIFVARDEAAQSHRHGQRPTGHFYCCKGARSAWIEDMVVLEAFRGRGVGKALLTRYGRGKVQGCEAGSIDCRCGQCSRS